MFATGQMGATRRILLFLNVTACPVLGDALYVETRMTLDLTRVSEVKVLVVALHFLLPMHPPHTAFRSAQHSTQYLIFLQHNTVCRPGD
ncbi:hypothetical protein E2C01_050276 [Portunus trituberculatus]|uniref:Secreted protein n=1 Tax=Portunus trituberculatus TaxID=210409 RepID=A0A5B7GBN0_PORTR|nr:hypothetical protein [Portunus trituberculatus]